MNKARKLFGQCEAAVMRVLTSIWILFALVATAAYAYWRMRLAWATGNLVQVQNAASWFQTLGLFIAAIITWAYVRTTERTLQVMRDVPELILEVMRAHVTLEGTKASAEILLRVTNLAAARLAVLHLESGRLGQDETTGVGFRVEDLRRTVSNTEVTPGTTNLKIYLSGKAPNQTPHRMLITVKMRNLSSNKELVASCEGRVSQFQLGGLIEVPDPAQT